MSDDYHVNKVAQDTHNKNNKNFANLDIWKITTSSETTTPHANPSLTPRIIVPAHADIHTIWKKNIKNKCSK